MFRTVKTITPMQETQVPFLGWDDPSENRVATPPVLLPGEFHGQKSLVGCSPWGHTNSQT